MTPEEALADARTDRDFLLVYVEQLLNSEAVLSQIGHYREYRDLRYALNRVTGEVSQ